MSADKDPHRERVPLAAHLAGWGSNTGLFAFMVALKLTGDLDWSWWWITIPLWAPIIIATVAFIAILILSKKGR